MSTRPNECRDVDGLQFDGLDNRFLKTACRSNVPTSGSYPPPQIHYLPASQRRCCHYIVDALYCWDRGGELSEDTTVHLPLLPPPPTVPDTSLHTNDCSLTYKSDLRVRPTCPTYVSNLHVRPTWLAYVSTLCVQLSDHIIILIIYLR